MEQAGQGRRGRASGKKLKDSAAGGRLHAPACTARAAEMKAGVAMCRQPGSGKPVIGHPAFGSELQRP